MRDEQYQLCDVRPSSNFQEEPPREVEDQTFDIFQPFFDPAMLDLFPGGDFPDLATFEANLDADHEIDSFFI